MQSRRKVFRVGLFDRIHKRSNYVLHHDEKKIDLSTSSSSDGEDDDGRIQDSIVDGAAADETFVGSEPDTNSPGNRKGSLLASLDDDDEDQFALSLLANHRYDLSPMDMGMLEVQHQQKDTTTLNDDEAVAHHYKSITKNIEAKNLFGGSTAVVSKKNNRGKGYDDSDDVHLSSLNDALPVEPVQPSLAPCNSFTSNPSFTTVNVMSRSSSFSSIGFVQDSPARGRATRQSHQTTPTRGQRQQQQQQQPRSSSLPPLPPKKASSSVGNKPPLLTENQISNILSTKEPTNKGLRLFVKLTQKLSTTDLEEDDKDQENKAQEVSSSGSVANNHSSVKTSDQPTESDGQEQRGASTDEVMSSLAALEELHRSSSTASSKNSGNVKLVEGSIPKNEKYSGIDGSKENAPEAEIDETRAALIESGRSALLGTANSTESSKTDEGTAVGSDEDTFVPGPKKSKVVEVLNKEMADPEKESPFQKISNRLEKVDTKKVSSVKSSVMPRSNINRNCRPENTTPTSTVISVSTIDAKIAEIDSPQVDIDGGISSPRTGLPEYSSHVEAFLEFKKSNSVKETQHRSFFPRDLIEFNISPEENVVVSCEGPPSTDELCNYKIFEDKSFQCGNATKQNFDYCPGRQVETDVGESPKDAANICETEPVPPNDDDTTKTSNQGSSPVDCSNVVGWNLGAAFIRTEQEHATGGDETPPTAEDTAPSKYTFPTVNCSKFLCSLPGAAAVFSSSDTQNVYTDVVSSEQAKATKKIYSDRIEIPNDDNPNDDKPIDHDSSIFAESQRAFRRACCMVDELLVKDARNVDGIEQIAVEEETNILLSTIPAPSQTLSQPPAVETNQDSHSCGKMFRFPSMKETWCNYTCGQTAQVEESEPEPEPELEFEPEPERTADARVSEDVQDQNENDDDDDDDFGGFCEFDDESVFGISVISALNISVISAATEESGNYQTNTAFRGRSCDRSQRSSITKKSADSISVVHKSFERPPSYCSKNIEDPASPTDQSCHQSEVPNTNRSTDSVASC